MLLKIIEGNFVISKIKELNNDLLSNKFIFLAITNQEISLVCKEEIVPKNTLEMESGFNLIRIEGVLEFNLVGILAKLASILAENQISIFVVSTFNTDYFLVKENSMDKTRDVLINQGYSFL